MRTPLSPRHIIQTYLILTFAISSNAIHFPETQATTTAPPSTNSLQARDFRDLTKPCGAFDKWVKADPGASCQSLSKDNGVTMQEFMLMNPVINPSCSNLVAGNTYCVGQLGGDFAHPGSTPTSTPTPPPSSTPPPPPPPPTTPAPIVTSPPVFRTVCLSTPSTCLSGSIGTDGSSYSSGCCNGCGTAGACDAAAADTGPLTWVCGCDGIMGRDFNGFIGNTTWVG